jgi:hypothetical protein
MDPRLQEMLDHHEIRKVLAEYCRGCDRCDDTAMAAVYAEDSWDDHGIRSGKGKQFAQSTVREMLDTTKMVSHLLGQSLIWVDGDSARAETYFQATLKYPPKNGIDLVNHIAGRYVDQLVREDGRWRIKRRLTLRDWSITHRVEQDLLAASGIVEGAQGADDPSYAALSQPFTGTMRRES